MVWRRADYCDTHHSRPQHLSGVRAYELEVSSNGSFSWTPLLTAQPVTHTIFLGTPGESYHFRLKATDNVSNESAWLEVGPIHCGFWISD